MNLDYKSHFRDGISYAWRAHVRDPLRLAGVLWARSGLLTGNLTMCHTLSIVEPPDEDRGFAGVTVLHPSTSSEDNEEESAMDPDEQPEESEPGLGAEDDGQGEAERDDPIEIGQSKENEQEVAASLADRVGRGDARAEAEFIRRYSSGLHFFLWHKSGDPALADDLHQDTFRIVLERLRTSTIERPWKLKNFIYATARYLVIDHKRKEARRNTVSNTPIVEDVADEGDHDQVENLIRHERALCVRRVIQELRQPRDREIIIRFYLAEQDKEAICRDLELTDRHFHRVLFRARRRLKELFDDLDGEDDPNGEN